MDGGAVRGCLGGDDGHRHRPAQRGAEPARGDGADLVAAFGCVEQRHALADRGAAGGAQAAAGAGRGAEFGQDPVRARKPPSRAPPGRRTFWIDQPRPACAGVTSALMSWP